MIDYLNVELLLDNPGSAVICNTKEEATQFLKYVKDEYPDRCRDWDPKKPFFHKDGVAYTFYWKDRNGMWNIDNLMHSSTAFVLSDGYTILNFHDLTNECEINESDISLDMLFHS